MDTPQKFSQEDTTALASTAKRLKRVLDMLAEHWEYVDTRKVASEIAALGHALEARFGRFSDSTPQ